MFAKISTLRIATLFSLAATSASLFAIDAASVKREHVLNYANRPTNVSEIKTFADAPANFDAVNASDEDRAQFGLPARPDPQAEPEHYAMWKRAMQAAKIRWHGEIRRAPAENSSSEMPISTELAASPAVTTTAPTNTTSYNWAGVVLTKSLGSYNKSQSFSDIYSLMTVQVGQVPFEGTCNDNIYDQLTWVGLNGYVKNAGIEPVASRGALIGGVESEVQCNATGQTSAFYFATFGWTPGSNFYAFNVRPGDIVYTEVGAPAGGTQPSYLFIEDLTTLTYNSYSVGVPAGFHYVGDTAEWIVSRPCCRASGSPYELLNTGETFFDGGAALDYAGNTLLPGSQVSSTQVITMRDDFNDQNIQLVYQGGSGYEGEHAVMMQTTGCAWSGICRVK